MGCSKFLYFAYGSNLLRERLRLHNPTATFVCVARLEGFYFHFCHTAKRWMGAIAAIHEKPDGHVWGIVWQLDESDKEHLDHQERLYTPIQVDVTTADKKTYHCRTYFLEAQDPTLPSPHYKDVIVRGAKQNHLPEDYIRFLESFQDNGFEGEIHTYNQVMEALQKSEQS